MSNIHVLCKTVKKRFSVKLSGDKMEEVEKEVKVIDVELIFNACIQMHGRAKQKAKKAKKAEGGQQEGVEEMELPDEQSENDSDTEASDLMATLMQDFGGALPSWDWDAEGLSDSDLELEAALQDAEAAMEENVGFFDDV